MAGRALWESVYNQRGEVEATDGNLSADRLGTETVDVRKAGKAFSMFQNANLQGYQRVA